MNKNGKGNAIYIILIPLIIIGILFIADTFISYNQKRNYKYITENVIKNVIDNEGSNYDNYYKEIKRVYEYNGYETDMLVVDASQYQIYVENEHEYFGIFSSLFGSGKEETIKLFGLIDFKAKKSSKVSLKVEATFDENDELQFEYVD